MVEELFERRQAERRYALNFLDYEILSDDGKVTGRGLARTLNVSDSGLRLETGQFFDPGQQLRITIGMENDLVQLTGKVVNSLPEDDNLCSSGILFIEFDETEKQIYQKHFAAINEDLTQ